MISEEQRHELHEALRHHIGDGPAASLMIQLFAMDPDRIATKEDLAELRGDVAELRGELHGEITAVRREITDLRGEHRSDIAQVRLDNARQTRQLTLTILIAFFAHFAATVGVVVSVA